jgi:hypothetical protein
MYDLVQSALTATIETVAIAGIAGIIVHAFYAQHTRWMDAYCPPVQDYTPDTQEETMAPFSEVGELAKALIMEVIPATDAALEALKKAVKEIHQPKSRKLV